jgi:hypothetical protein
MIPIHLKTPEFSEPASPLYYLVAANGVHLVRKTKLFTAVIAAPVVAGLETQTPTLTLAFDRLPRDLMERMYGFFLAVYRKWEGEAIVIIYYSPTQRRFLVGVPPQTLTRHRVSGQWRTCGRMDYGALRRPEGFLKLGDAHSHADLPAFFSHTDDEDDEEDGLRIVMGWLDRARPDLRVSFVAGGTRFMFEPEEVTESFSEAREPPESWLRRVSVCEEVRRRDHET